MANRKTVPAPLTGENLGPMSAEMRTELATQSREAQAEIAAIDAMCGDGEEYVRTNAIAKGKVGAQLYQQGGLMLGKALLLIKFHEEPGQFHHIVQVDLGMEIRTAQRLMQMTRGMLNADGSFKLSDVGGKPLASLSTSKLLELSTLSDADFAELEAGGSVGDVTKDRLPLMTARELREALRAAAEEKTADQTLIDQKDEKINKLQRALTKAQRGGVEFEEHAYLDTINEAQALAQEGLKGIVAGLAVLVDAQNALAAIEVPKHLDDVAKRAPVMTLTASTLQIAESLARVIWEQEGLFAKYINDAPRELAAINVQD